jgi:hypothetical protein
MEGDTSFKWLWLSQEVRHCPTTYCKWRPNPPVRSATWKNRKLRWQFIVLQQTSPEGRRQVGLPRTVYQILISYFALSLICIFTLKCTRRRYSFKDICTAVTRIRGHRQHWNCEHLKSLWINCVMYFSEFSLLERCWRISHYVKRTDWSDTDKDITGICNYLRKTKSKKHKNFCL